MDLRCGREYLEAECGRCFDFLIEDLTLTYVENGIRGWMVVIGDAVSLQSKSNTSSRTELCLDVPRLSFVLGD